MSKLEKADILELTVRHLQKMSQARRLHLTRNPLEDLQRFQSGYSSCAQEAASFLLSTPGVDVRISQRLLSHLSVNITTPGPVFPRLPPSATTTSPLRPSPPSPSPLQRSFSPPQSPHPLSPPSCSTSAVLRVSAVSLSPETDERKTVPIKPAPIRFGSVPGTEIVWRPYS